MKLSGNFSASGWSHALRWPGGDGVLRWMGNESAATIGIYMYLAGVAGASPNQSVYYSLLDADASSDAAEGAIGFTAEPGIIAVAWSSLMEGNIWLSAVDPSAEANLCINGSLGPITS